MVNKRTALLMKWFRFLRFLRWQFILSQEFWSRVYLKALYRLQKPAEQFRKEKEMRSVDLDPLEEIYNEDLDHQRYGWHVR